MRQRQEYRFMDFGAVCWSNLKPRRAGDGFQPRLLAWSMGSAQCPVTMQKIVRI